MAFIGENDSIMRPIKGSSKVYLPITFDYSGGRSESSKGRMLWAIVIAVIGIILGLGTIFSKEGFFLVNLLLGIIIMFLFSLIIRFPILKEHNVRNAMLSRKNFDYKEETDSMWGIYEIDNMYPYYAHMRNGKVALFVLFEKDVILGKEEDSKYSHYEAIADAYNLAGSAGIGLCHIDGMDVIGNDERLVECFRSLPSITNTDMRDLLTDIYTNLEDIMDERFTTYDIYVFTSKDNEASFRYQVNKIINCLLDANFRSFKILDSNGIRWLAKSINNLYDFSVTEACYNSFKVQNYSGIVPISVTYSDGSELKINKTSAEKKAEVKLREKEDRLRKEEKKNRKKTGKKSSSIYYEDEEIDLFND